MAVTTTPRLGLTRWSAGTDPFTRAQMDTTMANLEANAAMFASGTLGARPAFGKAGRFYQATDAAAEGPTVYYDTGTAWIEIRPDLTGYTTAAELATGLATKANSSHSHTIADIPVATSGGVSSTQVVRADDSRLSNARTPTAHTHVLADVTNAGTAAALNVPATGDAAVGEVVKGNDTRLTNARTPVTHSHLIADLPVAASGVSNSTTLVRADDSRLSDNRTPVAHVHAAADVTSGTFPIARGGTNGTATPTAGAVAYGTGSAYGFTAAGTAKQALVSNAGGAPSWATLDLTYVPDAWVKKSVRVATTANITLSAPQTVDGIAVVAGDRVLVKNQTTASANGIYVVAAGAWTRDLDADAAAEIGGATVNVDQGTANGGQIWSTTFKTTDTLGTTNMSWYRMVDGAMFGAANGVAPLDASGLVAIADLPVATSGTSSSTQLVRADDSRLSNARTPSAHVHAISEITSLQTTLDDKMPDTLGGAEKTAAGSATTGTSTLNLANASIFTISPTAAVTLSPSNVPASGTAATITVILTQGATAYPITMPAGTIWLGSAPTQTPSKKCVITMMTIDGGSSWIASGAVQA